MANVLSQSSIVLCLCDSLTMHGWSSRKTLGLGDKDGYVFDMTILGRVHFPADLQSCRYDEEEMMETLAQYFSEVQ